MIKGAFQALYRALRTSLLRFLDLEVLLPEAPQGSRSDLRDSGSKILLSTQQTEACAEVVALCGRTRQPHYQQGLMDILGKLLQWRWHIS